MSRMARGSTRVTQDKRRKMWARDMNVLSLGGMDEAG